MEIAIFDAEITINKDANYFFIDCNGFRYKFEIKNKDVKAYQNDTELTLKYLGFERRNDPMDNHSSVLFVRAKFKDPDIQTDLYITFKQRMPTLKIGQIFNQLQEFNTNKETTDGEAKSPDGEAKSPDASDKAAVNTGGGDAIKLRLF